MMMVRRPLVPCSIASHSMSRSQICQNGLAHLPATKPKSMACTPSPAHRLTKRWPKMRMTRMTPETRMNSHANSSNVEVVDLDREYPVLGAGMDVVLMSASEGVHQLAGNEGDHDDEPHNHDSPEQLLLISRAALREVDENDAKTVERMECDGGDESDLTECHDRCLVGSDHCVIGLGRDADEGSIEHVDQKEEEDSDACDAMRAPGPHSFVSSVQSARRRFGHGASSILIIRVCTSRNYAQDRSRASRDTPERAGSHLNPGNSLKTGIPRLTNSHL